MDNHWLPAKGSGTTHLNDHLQPWISTAEFTEGQQLGTGQNLPLQQPENHGFVAKQALAEERHDLLDLTDCGTTANALVAKMGRPDSVLLKQRHLHITQTTS